MPVEPPPSVWELPDPRQPGIESEIVGVGADLEPGTLLAAYRNGVFPMPLPAGLRDATGGVEPIGWWSPDPRGVLPLDGLKISKSLRKSCRRFEVTVDTAFDDVIAGCADPTRPHGWIDSAIVKAYRQLHELGWVHSVEVWNRDTGALAGGLYGVGTGALFAGESMFHNERDASKVALVALVDLLRGLGVQLLDVQWPTEHLESLGIIAIPRDDYLDRLAVAANVPCDALGPPDKPWRFESFADRGEVVGRALPAQ